MLKPSLNFTNIIFIFLLSTGLFGHVEIIPVILSTAGKQSWISILLAVIPLFFVIFIIGSINSDLPKKPLLQLLNEQSSSWQYYLLLMPIALYLVISAFITCKEIIYWSQLSYMQGFNAFVIGLALLVVCWFCAEAGFIKIGIISAILCPIVIFLGFFVSFANTKKKNFELLLPLVVEDIGPIGKAAVYTAMPILELILLLFFVSHLKTKLTRKKVFFLGILLIGLILGPTIAGIAEFGPKQAASFRYPAYEQWRIITVGRYFSHTDFFAIYQWLSGAVIRISVFILLAAQMINKGKVSFKFIRSIFLLVFIVTIIKIDQNIFYTFVYEFYLPIACFFLTFQCLLLWLYVLNKKKKWKGANLEYEE
ncbi:endospore germination permease [Niallia taxi]|uniref:endospore germination permease n=1 Tax=Niallia taxi TaxID=2499688 RepID=UPI003176A7AA